MREFFGGIGTLVRGFGYWRRTPGPMVRGLIPAGIVGLVMVAALVTLAAFLGTITEAISPFADDWDDPWRQVVRVAIGTAIFGGAIVLAAVSFTALTLIVGEPFYDRVWRAVEADLGGAPADSDYGFWRSVRDGIGLVLRGILAAITAGLVGLVPVIGGALGVVTAVFLTGWLLADELTSRALSARGIPSGERRRLVRGQRARALGFGVATQLCFMVPLGAVVTMPAAVAASTVLARRLLETQPAVRPGAVRPGAVRPGA
jgi:CysZ protein